MVDEKFGRDTLDQLTGSNIWIGRPEEEPGSRPLSFESDRNRIGSSVARRTTEATSMIAESFRRIRQLWPDTTLVRQPTTHRALARHSADRAHR
ncbi:2-deoxy-5-keto-D-gluconate 6-phosphate aldolase domain-containing protein [Afipia birgiae]|uniref:2-deoxy-5-keto-D-gluconate 6-phosphate aldolase domain-containing protein n=1 Tax=Afipia birgiae TaxID=151414 RepID=UPI003D31758C